ncbi:hypothetical protein CDAR_588201 [Caerostris darwini]|uniref:Uncharacterized protein n=1 Tax=Caerostris darwini TaxID=1538125 RepID=A0AAV4S5A2_9ARAC|nr:hypothetical protein CDAR_588201 [Caerostris darwini]
MSTFHVDQSMAIHLGKSIQFRALPWEGRRGRIVFYQKSLITPGDVLEASWADGVFQKEDDAEMFGFRASVPESHLKCLQTLADDVSSRNCYMACLIEDGIFSSKLVCVPQKSLLVVSRHRKFEGEGKLLLGLSVAGAEVGAMSTFHGAQSMAIHLGEGIQFKTLPWEGRGKNGILSEEFDYTW